MCQSSATTVINMETVEPIMARAFLHSSITLHVAPSIMTLHSSTCTDNFEETAHYVAQGRTSWSGWGSHPDYYCQGDGSNQALYSSSVHGTNIGVGCCSEDGTKGYRPNCNAHPATYDDAVAVCSDAGYRLCTLTEMMTGITRGKGCWYDAAYQWVSDSCDISDNAVGSHSRFEDDFEDPQHFKMIDAMNDAALNTLAISLTGKDLFILALLILNVVSLAILVSKCTKCCNRAKVNYEAVSVLSENEV